MGMRKKVIFAVPTKLTKGTAVFREVDAKGIEVPRAKATIITPYLQLTALPKDVKTHPLRIKITIEDAPPPKDDE